MRKQIILVLIGFAAICSAATKCGDAAWWTDIKSNLIEKWKATDSFVTNFNTLKTAYDALQATAVTDAHEVTKGHCKSYFTVGTDKSCCSLADHKKMINLAVKASIAAAIPPGREDACHALKYAFQKAASDCNKAKASASAVSSSSGSSSGSMSSGSMSGSSSMSSSASSTGRPESTQKLLDKAEKAGRKAEAKSKKALGDAALTIAQQLRGTLCAICGDPDAKSKIFDPATKTWTVNQGAMDDYITKIQKALNETAANGKDCLDFVQYNSKRYEKVLGTCEKAVTVINDYKAKLQPCATDAECQQKATDCFNPLTTGCVNNIAVDNTATGRRNMRAEVRILAGPTYQASATGGATAAADQTEDNALSIGGSTLTTINQQASTAETEFNATGGGAVDYDAAIEAETGVSTILAAFASLILLLVF